MGGLRKENPTPAALKVRRRVERRNMILFPDLPGEEWRVIENFPRYRASQLGRIRSENNRILKRSVGSTGYCVVGIRNANGQVKTMKVHRIIAMTFCSRPNDPEASTVNHIDGDKMNNRADNLEWLSSRDNFAHAVANRLHSHGESNGKSKLTVRSVANILHMQDEARQVDIARWYGVDSATIGHVIRRRSWKHVA